MSNLFAVTASNGPKLERGEPEEVESGNDPIMCERSSQTIDSSCDFVRRHTRRTLPGHHQPSYKKNFRTCIMLLASIIVILCTTTLSSFVDCNHPQVIKKPPLIGGATTQVTKSMKNITSTTSNIKSNLQLNTTTTTTTSKAPLQDSQPSAPISLVIFRDEPSFKFISSTNNNNSTTTTTTNSSSSQSQNQSHLLSSANQLKRHTYNLTGAANTTDHLISNNAASANSTVGGGDPLDTSDSYFSPRHRAASARFDAYGTADEAAHENDGHGFGGGGGGESSSDEPSDPIDEYASIDGASSNLSEKKVVKELTKILSKGMSGATDQVRVETLENLKKRQRERKALKDNRARVFEEILTKAIESHPDNTRTVKKSPGGGAGGKKSQRVRGSSSNLMKSYPSPLPASSAGDVDPELASDAETVLQHLQGLASAIDSPGLSGSSSSDALSPTPVSELAESDDSSSSLGSGSGSGSESSSSDAAGGGGDESGEERPKKATSSSTTSERPLVRQFKKIKNQLSQRRKQLDQIKKLFNIELALDPKNGSLIGKQVSSESGGGKKKQQAAAVQQQYHQHHQHHQQQQFESDSSSDSYPPSDDFSSGYGESLPAIAGRRTKSQGGRADKGRELLSYLRANPEILASVMAELTVDADPSSSSSSSRPHSAGSRGSSGNGSGGGAADSDTESPSPYHHSLAAANDYDEAPSASSRRKLVRGQQSKRLQQVDPDDIVWAKPPRSRRAHAASSSSSSSSKRSRGSISSRLSSESSGGFGSQTSASSFSAQPIKRRTAESLLLESLRERQLLNLARLDLVLAERAAANKTTTSSHAGEQQSQQDHMESYRRSSYDPEQAGGRAPPLAGQSGNGGILYTSGSSNYYQPRSGGASQNRSSLSETDEVNHHFMMVNPTYAGNDTLGRQLNSNEYLGTFNSERNRPPPPYQPFDRPPYGPPPTAPVSPYSYSGSQNYNSSTGAQQSNYSPPTTNSQLRPSQVNQSPLPLPPPPPPPPPAQPGGPNSLRRFRDWRDVSQSELDRASLPPPPPPPPAGSNISWHPGYDLSTGGGTPLASTMEAQSSKSTQFVNYRTGQVAPPSSLANVSNNSSGSLQAAANQLAQSSGGGANQQNGEQLGAGNNNANSLFMTRSSVAAAAEPDVTTVRLSAYDNDQAKEGDKQQQSRRANSDLKGATPAEAAAAAGARQASRSDEDDDEPPTRRAAESDEESGQPAGGGGGGGGGDVEETANGSGSASGGGGSSSPHAADYFSAYKDEIASSRKRRKLRAQNHRQQQQQQQRDLQSDMDSDDTGAMWAA